MTVTIIIPTALRQYADDRAELHVESQTVGDALDDLTRTFPELRRHLYNDQNHLRNFVNIYLNDEDIRHTNGSNTTVRRRFTLLLLALHLVIRRNYKISANAGCALAPDKRLNELHLGESRRRCAGHAGDKVMRRQPPDPAPGDNQIRQKRPR